MIRIGTSGFSYADWKGCFYPEGIRSEQYLFYYADHFKTCELNFSYYRMPTARQLDKMVSTTGGALIFTLKAHQSLTHQRTGGKDSAVELRSALKPLLSSRTLGAVLMQFPYSFGRNQANLSYLKTIRDWLSDVPLVIEFRNQRWIGEETFELLKELNFGFCCVDEPQLKGLLPPLHVVTSKDTAYVRFHGRNAQDWWDPPTPAQRYNYLYSAAELSPWVARIHKMDSLATNTFVFMNNHFAAKAVQNAQMLMQMLGLSAN